MQQVKQIMRPETNFIPIFKWVKIEYSGGVSGSTSVFFLLPLFYSTLMCIRTIDCTFKGNMIIGLKLFPHIIHEGNLAYKKQITI